ncbi:MAG: hypothetical protein IKK29_02570, partial [Christensenellaceae bacterium]|nr:hypothetical protein [Christensenellaceae bacterium]
MNKGKNVALKMIKQIDWVLVAIVMVLLVFGLVAIISCTSDLSETEGLPFWDFVDLLNFEQARLQMVYFGVGLLLLIVMLLFDYNHLRDYTNLIYWAS